MKKGAWDTYSQDCLEEKLPKTGTVYGLKKEGCSYTNGKQRICFLPSDHYYIT